ncbi:hypothetical protein SARC_11488 [Sphaeroforma arctica JP610]|uniref:Uncharacterized protein n=1 Tax=Sphaeroforma arctica JP610 TaxID=667725 RepID=A0A0L0FGW7_9EUKA|nr:hypothetical protein SARC_11488 [Sphaeroforma arctica JP610]KNC76000.1 hypothetical protein SARC_11488 [Sphaeroforma arctica JP610]|eukprot:XP_014149902.1 hypothetical protein SARC_11488 [Sphaeroforma arctica JP610]
MCHPRARSKSPPSVETHTVHIDPVVNAMQETQFWRRRATDPTIVHSEDEELPPLMSASSDDEEQGVGYPYGQATRRYTDDVVRVRNHVTTVHQIDLRPLNLIVTGSAIAPAVPVVYANHPEHLHSYVAEQWARVRVT